MAELSPTAAGLPARIPATESAARYGSAADANSRIINGLIEMSFPLPAFVIIRYAPRLPPIA